MPNDDKIQVPTVDGQLETVSGVTPGSVNSPFPAPIAESPDLSVVLGEQDQSGVLKQLDEDRDNGFR